MRPKKWTIRAITSFLLSSAVLMTPASWSHRLAEAATVSAAQTQNELTDSLQRRLNERRESFSISLESTVSTTAVTRVLTSVLEKDDYLKYSVRSYEYKVVSRQSKSTVTFDLKYWENAEQTAYVKARSKQILSSIITSNMNTHQRVKAIHDWVLLNVAYDQSLVKHSAYDALKTGKTVCQGYAMLTYRLLTDAGIPSRIVEGYVASGAHAWNLMKLDGSWYQLDTTFDDPVPDVAGRTDYSYYLLTDDQLKKDHRWTGSYPEANSSYASALEAVKIKDTSRKGFYDGLTEDLGYALLSDERTADNTAGIAAIVRKAINGGQTSVKFRYTGEENMKSELKSLLKLIPQLASINYSTTPYGMGDDGDLLVELSFTLQQ